MNMNCQACQRLIAQRPPSSLKNHGAAWAHLSACETCRHCYEDAHLKLAFEQMARVPENPGLHARVRANMQNHRKPPKPVWFKQVTHSGLAYAAVAASFLMLGILLQPLVSSPTPSPQMAWVSVSVGKLETVEVMLNSEFAYQDTELSVAMHGAISLDAQGSIQRVAWQSNLHKGKNILPLPVYLASPAGGEIHVQMKTADGRKDFIFKVNAKAAVQRMNI